MVNFVLSLAYLPLIYHIFPVWIQFESVYGSTTLLGLKLRLIRAELYLPVLKNRVLQIIFVKLFSCLYILTALKTSLHLYRIDKY